MITIAALLFAVSPLAAQDRLVYRETTSGRVENFIVDIAGPPNAPDLTKHIDGEIYRELCDPSWNTREATILLDEREATVTRDGDVLRARWSDGTLAVYDIDGAPWRQNLFRLSDFIGDERSRKTEFWMVSPNFRTSPDEPPKLKTMRFTLKKTGREIVDVGGREVEAIRTELRPDGFIGLFWSADYWFRAEDGLMVKYAMARGAPGTPVTEGVLAAD